MPGHASSPYWTTVDFDSEGDEEKTPPPSNRVYLDPWDNDAFGMLQGESPDSSQEQMNSFAGEPVSASFYYVPTKTYDSGEEPKPSKRSLFPEDVITPDYSVYGRRTSRHNMIPPDYDRDMPIYGYRPMPERRRSMYIEEPVYIPIPHPMVYESLYGPMPMPNPYMHPPRPRMSLQHHPDYVMANGYGKHRRHSRLAEAYEQYAYETLSPEYEDWARPMPKTAPDNFHLSRDSLETNKNNALSSSSTNTSEGPVHFVFSISDNGPVTEEKCNNVDLDSDAEYKLEYVECERKWSYREQIRIWSLKHKCSHAALKDLFQILNQITPNAMPKDPRSLLGTPREITINFVDPGEYWHNNLKNSIIKS